MADVDKMREALERAERKLAAYVGVCKGDKELTDAVLPMVRKALAEQPSQGEAVGEVYRYGKDSQGRPWHGIHWYDANVNTPHGTKLYTAPPAPSVPASTVNELTQDDFTTVLEFQAYRSGFKAGKASQPAQGEAAAAVPRFTYGHCADRRQVGGCIRHNLHCGYPDCDRKEVPRG